MLTVTERAGQELKGILSAHATDPKHVLRIEANAQGFNLWIGEVVEGDAVVGSQETAVLHVAPELGQALERISMVIDMVETNEGPHLVIYRGDEAVLEGCPSECDCGSECQAPENDCGGNCPAHGE